jgi:hypothetical protein
MGNCAKNINKSFCNALEQKKMHAVDPSRAILGKRDFSETARASSLLVRAFAKTPTHLFLKFETRRYKFEQR